MSNQEKISAIAERLAKLSPEAQEEELAKIERNVTKRESKAQKGALTEHKTAMASAFVDTLIVYCREKKLEPDVFLPLGVRITKSEDGKGLEGSVSGRGSGKGSGGTRSESFLKANGVVAIELNGTPIARCSEIEVLRACYGKDKAKEIVGTASAHQVAMKSEHQKAIKEKNFVAIDAQGGKRPLSTVYAAAAKTE